MENQVDGATLQIQIPDEKDSRWEFCDISSCPTSLNVTTVVIEKKHPSIANPVGYEVIYSSEGTPDDKNLTLWNPIAPPGGYSCPGQVAKTDYDGLPVLSDVACVLESYLRKNDLSGSTFVWNDNGSKATSDGSIWQCKVDKSIANKIRCFYKHVHRKKKCLKKRRRDNK